jgi:hypothetical protein
MDAQRASASLAEEANDVGAAQARSDSPELVEAITPETRDMRAPHGWATPTKEFSVFAQSLGGAKQEESLASPSPSNEEGAHAGANANVGADIKVGAAADADASAAVEDRRGRVARVRETTRARVDQTRARVEKMKDDAIVALEETPDDSGLRFVIVAVVVFVLSLLILLLSVTVLR